MKNKTHKVQFCVVGGGFAGMCAAISAARHGAKVALIQDRPVLGGNASGEIRVPVCGAQGLNNRETDETHHTHYLEALSEDTRTGVPKTFRPPLRFAAFPIAYTKRLTIPLGASCEGMLARRQNLRFPEGVTLDSRSGNPLQHKQVGRVVHPLHGSTEHAVSEKRSRSDFSMDCHNGTAK